MSTHGRRCAAGSQELRRWGNASLGPALSGDWRATCPHKATLKAEYTAPGTVMFCLQALVMRQLCQHKRASPKDGGDLPPVVSR